MFLSSFITYFIQHNLGISRKFSEYNWFVRGQSNVNSASKTKNKELNKTQTAVINILNLHILIMTWRFVCTLHTFSKVTVEI